MECAGSVSCVLCTVNLPQRSLALPLDPAAILSFTKLLRGTEAQPDTPVFSGSPYLLFCFNCHAKVHEIHETFKRLDILREQLTVFRIEVEGEILRSNNVNVSWERNKTAALRQRIIQELCLETGTKNEHSDLTNEHEILYSFKVDAEVEDPYNQDPHYQDQDQSFTVEDTDIDHDFVQDNFPVEDSDPFSHEEGEEFDPCFGFEVPQTQDQSDFDPCLDVNLLSDGHKDEDVNTEAYDQVAGDSNPSQEESNHYNLKPCRINLGRRIDEGHDVAPSSTGAVPRRCPYPGCTSKSRFSAGSRLQYNRHLKTHGVDKENKQGFYIDPIPTSNPLLQQVQHETGHLKFPTKCPRDDCMSNKTFHRRQLLRHLKDVHFKQLKPRIVEPNLEDKLDSLLYPVMCFEPNCARLTPFATKDELRRHLRSAHSIQTRIPRFIDPVVNETKHTEYPTHCPREGCASTKLYTHKAQLRRHLRCVHGAGNHGALELTFEREMNISELQPLTIEVGSLSTSRGGIGGFSTATTNVRRPKKRLRSLLRRRRTKKLPRQASKRTRTDTPAGTDSASKAKRIRTTEAVGNCDVSDGTTELKPEIDAVPLTRLRPKISRRVYAESDSDGEDTKKSAKPAADDTTDWVPCTYESCVSKNRKYRSELHYRVHLRHVHKERRRPEGWSRSFPERCQKQGCTSTLIFQSLKQYRRHMRTHAEYELRLPMNPIQAETSGLQYPRKCTREDCISERLYSDRSSLRRHLVHVHYRNPDPDGVTIQPNLKDEILKQTFPTHCYKPNCTSQMLFDNPEVLKRHIRAAHNIRIRQPRWMNKVTPELQGLTFPTKCIREDCKSEKLYSDRAALRRHLVHVHSRNPNGHTVQPNLKDEILEHTFPTHCYKPNCTSKLLFHTPEVLKRHIRAAHKIRIREPRWNNKITAELEGVTFPTRYIRQDCTTDKVFRDRDVLRRHLKVFHRTGRKRYDDAERNSDQPHVCTVCGLVFLSALSVHHHERQHVKIVNFNCEHCGSGFKSKNGLKVHVEAHHSTVPQVFLCTQCPKTFKIKRGLDIHMMRHNGAKKYFCRVCPKGYLFRMDVTEHEQYVHWQELGLEQIKCSVCQKVYSKRGLLRMHMRSHTGEQRFPCTECEYKTDNKNDYREHVATVHQTDFPFGCNMCDKRFKLERRLRQHELEHKEAYTIACELCDKRFATARTLRIHNERRHGALPANREDRQGIIAEFTV